eukprot:Skav201082  [mRNA]  locus=scaffold2138:110574:113872:- [translate_table: standard]
MGALHSAPGPKSFGFEVNNTTFGGKIGQLIGETPQQNPWCDDWVDFFLKYRLKVQVERADDSYASSLLDAIAPDLKMLLGPRGLFADVTGSLRPSLLHGDFWSGNVAMVEGHPVLFDPAAYYGHHEAGSRVGAVPSSMVVSRISLVRLPDRGDPVPGSGEAEPGDEKDSDSAGVAE